MIPREEIAFPLLGGSGDNNNQLNHKDNVNNNNNNNNNSNTGTLTFLTLTRSDHSPIHIISVSSIYLIYLSRSLELLIYHSFNHLSRKQSIFPCKMAE